MPALKGIDNVLFGVTDLDAAVAFYTACGFVLKFKVDEAKMALFSIGAEEPGLLIRATGSGSGKLWVEVANADEAAAELNAAGIATKRLETMTGITVEATDPDGNVVGFADYSKRPEMARA
jgi:catechol 2,3-dioxygenase-like lactoylglutathione lyase family enzyme